MSETEPTSLVWLGRKGTSHAHDPQWYEQRHGEPVNARGSAAEIAPGIWVALLLTGGHTCRESFSETWGGLIAVWDEREDPGPLVLPPDEPEAARIVLDKLEDQ